MARLAGTQALSASREPVACRLQPCHFHPICTHRMMIHARGMGVEAMNGEGEDGGVLGQWDGSAMQSAPLLLPWPRCSPRAGSPRWAVSPTAGPAVGHVDWCRRSR